MIDFRSDTVTKPSAAMREAMANAEVGDDVFGDDPTINALEELAAKMFEKEAALYCSSGTMTNQIAINVHTQMGDEVICHEEAHIYRYEGGGIARNSGASVRLLRGNQGRINPADIESNLNPDDPHYPNTSLICLEDTSNRGGGVCYDVKDIEKIRSICIANNLPLHLDGARVFNALTENGMTAKQYGAFYDSISICLSKGLGAPVGSLLLGSKDFIKKSRRVRKVFGGGMRQAGIIAAGAIYALENNIERLKDDHSRAKKVAELLRQHPWIESVLPVETNIVVGHMKEGHSEQEFVQGCLQKDIACVAFGLGRVRFTTHLDITDDHINQLEQSLTF